MRTQCLINGAWVGGNDIAVTNPATGAILGRVPRFGRAEAEEAVAAAKAAFPVWSGRLAKGRSQILRRWFDLVMANQDRLAGILTAEQGKPLAEARGEIAYAASYIEYYAEEAKRIYGETIPSHIKNGRIVVPLCVHGGTAAAQRRLVHDVVVHQGEVVEQFHRHGRRHRVGRLRPLGFARRQGQQGADPFAPQGQQIVNGVVQTVGGPFWIGRKEVGEGLLQGV